MICAVSCRRHFFAFATDKPPAWASDTGTNVAQVTNVMMALPSPQGMVPSSVASVWGNENKNMNSFLPASEGSIPCTPPSTYIYILLLACSYRLSRFLPLIFAPDRFW